MAQIFIDMSMIPLHSTLIAKWNGMSMNWVCLLYWKR